LVAIPSSSSLGTTVPIPPYVLLYSIYFRVTHRGPQSPGALKGPQRAPPRTPSGISVRVTRGLGLVANPHFLPENFSKSF